MNGLTIPPEHADQFLASALFLLVFYMDSAAEVDLGLVRDHLDALGTSLRSPESAGG